MHALAKVFYIHQESNGAKGFSKVTLYLVSFFFVFFFFFFFFFLGGGGHDISLRRVESEIGRYIDGGR